MAVVLTYPADPGQLGKNASGVVAAFTATGYQNEGSGLTVTITDQTLGGRVLGSGPSSSTAEVGGLYDGWWAFSVPCPAYDSTGATIAEVEAADAFVAMAATLRARAAQSEAATAADDAASTETAEGYMGGESETVLAYADGSTRLRVVVGDVFSGPASDASAATVSTGGGSVSVSDDFQTGSGGLGANWTTLATCSAPGKSAGVLTYGAGDSGAYWSANAFSPNHASETVGGAPAARMQVGEKSCYYALWLAGEEEWGLELHKVVDGVDTVIGTPFVTGSDPSAWALEIAANGATITVRTAPTHGGTYTDRISYPDPSPLSGGAPGTYRDADFAAGMPMGWVEAWWGRDL